MKIKTAIVLSTLVTMGVGNLILPDTAVAGGPFNMMNPSKWFGKNRNNDDDYYDDRYNGGPGYGYGGPGYGYGAPGYGYGAPGYGYGAPGYGYGAPGYAAPGYGYSAPAYAIPAQPAAPAAPNGGDSSTRIKALEDRIRHLESNQQQPTQAYDRSRFPAAPQSGHTTPAAPYPPPPAGGKYEPAPNSAFRPTN